MTKGQVFPSVTPNIDARRIGHLELKIIRRPRAFQIKAELKGLGQMQRHLAPQCHKSATTMKVILQTQTAGLTPAHPPLRTARRKDLP